MVTPDAPSDMVLAAPNLSWGRDGNTVAEIAGSRRVLDTHLDADHNRAVITYGADPLTIVDVCQAMVERAIRVADIRAHTGVHPRFGVVDVLPLIAYRASERDVAGAAVHLAERIEMLRVPVFFYGRADREQRTLPELRRFLRFGNHRAHETAGVVCLGIRDPLVAFNVNFRGGLASARDAARRVRGPDIRALGFELPSRGLVQVSMNLIAPDAVGPKAAFDRVLASAGDLDLVDCEVVGLVPHQILEQLKTLPLRARVRSIEQALEDHESRS